MSMLHRGCGAAGHQTMPSLPTQGHHPARPDLGCCPTCWDRNQVTATYFWASSFTALGYPGNPLDTAEMGKWGARLIDLKLQPERMLVLGRARV